MEDNTALEKEKGINYTDEYKGKIILLLEMGITNGCTVFFVAHVIKSEILPLQMHKPHPVTVFSCWEIKNLMS